MIRQQMKRLSTLANNREGNVLPLVAVGVLVSAALVGGGVDMSRAYKVQNRLQSSCDAAALAGRRAVTTGGFDSAAQTQANAYFNSNFNATEQGATGTAFTVTSDDNGQTVNGTATTTLPTAVMRIFGYNDFNLSVTCVASMGVGNSDVTMVIDTTGSMADPLVSGGPSKISLLKDAMKSFYDTVDAATAASNARVRYAFVPYSSSVNVGHLIYDLNPNYLVNTYKIQSRKPITRSVTTEEFDHWKEPPVITTQTGSSVNTTIDQNYYNNTSYTTSALCLAALPANTPWTNQGGSSVSTSVVINAQGQQVTTRTTSQPQRQTQYTCVTVIVSRRTTYRTYYYTYQRSAYDYYIETRDPVTITVTNDVFDHWSYEQVQYDTSAYKAFAAATTPTGANGTDQTSTWEGCIEERQTTPAATFTYNGLTGKIDPTAATDLDIDTAPTGDDKTKWAPMWPQVAYYRTSSSTGSSLTAATTSLYGRQAPSYCPARARALAEMTKSEFDGFADSLSPNGSTYHDLGMIWGARVSSPDGMWASIVNDPPTNGGTVSRHLVFLTDGQMSNNYAIQTTYGIEYHDRRVTSDGVTNSELRHTNRYLAVCQAIKAKGIRIWVIAYSTGLTTDLSTCASANSAFTANSSTQLNRAFQEIAKQVGELRITQ